jgi:hypothetical protein
MATPDDASYFKLDILNLDPVTDALLTKGAEWYEISPQRFADVCVERYIDSDPDFLAKAVRAYVDQLVADLPNAADHFELK